MKDAKKSKGWWCANSETALVGEIYISSAALGTGADRIILKDEMSKWCRRNCIDKFVDSYEWMAFQSEDDAIRFKLVFGGTLITKILK